MGIPRAYIDSYYLLEVVFGGKNRYDAERILYKASKGSFDVFVLQVVLGEVVSKILVGKKPARHAVCALVDTIEKYNIDVRKRLVPVDKGAFAIMRELRDKDQRLEGTDIMILAHVLHDPDSKFFLTTDRKMINNQMIADYEEEMRRSKRRNTELKITDSVG